MKKEKKEKTALSSIGGALFIYLFYEKKLLFRWNSGILDY
jgi:hypothetical protein